MQTVADFYTERNAELIRQWLKLTGSGMNVRKASKTVAENNEGISEALVNGIIYTKNYPYAAQAWAIIHKEEAERKEKGKKGAAKAATGGVAFS